MKNDSTRSRIISILVLGVLIGLSLWFGTAFASSESFHTRDIEYLEEKQNNAKALSASASTASVLVSLLPEDTATPLANQISDIGRDFMVILSALTAERYLLTIAGRITFCWLVPIALGILILFVLLRRKLFLQIGVKLAIAGCVLYMLVPVTLRITRLVESPYEEAVGSSLQQSKEIQDIFHFNENGILLPGMSNSSVNPAIEAGKVPEGQEDIRTEAQTQMQNTSEASQASSAQTEAEAQALKAQAPNTNKTSQASTDGAKAPAQVKKAGESGQVTPDGTKAPEQVKKAGESGQASTDGAKAPSQVKKAGESGLVTPDGAKAPEQVQKDKPKKELPWYEQLWSGINGAVSCVVDTASKLVEGIVETVSGVVQTVSDAAAAAVDAVIETGEKAVSLIELAPKVPQMAADLLNSLIDAFVLMIVTTCVLPLAVLIGMLFIMNQVLNINPDWEKTE